MRRRGLVLACLLLAVLAGCKEEPPPRTALTLGAHQLSVVLPEGWEGLDYGDTYRLRRDFWRIEMWDLGARGGALDVIADTALRRLGETEQRDEAARQPGTIAGRPAITVDTWDRLSHAHRKRFVFIRNERAILGVATTLGPFEALEAAFDGLVASIAFADTLVGDRPPE
jgi:hypothetical protein